MDQLQSPTDSQFSEVTGPAILPQDAQRPREIGAQQLGKRKTGFQQINHLQERVGERDARLQTVFTQAHSETQEMSQKMDGQSRRLLRTEQRVAAHERHFHSRPDLRRRVYDPTTIPKSVLESVAICGIEELCNAYATRYFNQEFTDTLKNAEGEVVRQSRAQLQANLDAQAKQLQDQSKQLKNQAEVIQDQSQRIEDLQELILNVFTAAKTVTKGMKTKPVGKDEEVAEIKEELATRDETFTQERQLVYHTQPWDFVIRGKASIQQDQSLSNFDPGILTTQILISINKFRSSRRATDLEPGLRAIQHLNPLLDEISEEISHFIIQAIHNFLRYPVGRGTSIGMFAIALRQLLSIVVDNNPEILAMAELTIPAAQNIDTRLAGFIDSCPAEVANLEEVIYSDNVEQDVGIVFQENVTHVEESTLVAFPQSAWFLCIEYQERTVYLVEKSLVTKGRTKSCRQIKFVVEGVGGFDEAIIELPIVAGCNWWHKQMGQTSNTPEMQAVLERFGRGENVYGMH